MHRLLYKMRLFLRLYFEKIFSLSFVLLLVPGFFTYELTFVRDAIIKYYKPRTLVIISNIAVSLFLFINLVGNMVLSIFSDTRVKRSDVKGHSFCKQCELWQPEKSFHCTTCNVCILKRDHHCIFLAKCIGLHNYRYFILTLAYLVLGLVYSLYWNYYFIALKFESMLFEILRFLTTIRLMYNDYYITFLLFNVISIGCAFYMFWIHMMNATAGVTSYECNRLNKAGNSNWRENLVQVFGTKWYYTLIWPFADSPVPKK